MDTQPASNLPEQPTSMLGRDQELKAARALLLSDDVRLLTLTGAPGVGKTRLAIEAARSVGPAFPDGVWFIDLAPLRDPTLVGSKIASTFGVAVVQNDSALDSLAAYLRGRRVLLFLDSFERVLPAASWISGLLERTPGLTILATSREPLRLRWEQLMPILPLPAPDLSLLPEFLTLISTACIELFVQRATAVNPGFVLSPENAPAVATLCGRLDGLPLAIELAAARAGVLSPAEILTTMDDRFRVLGMGALDLPERHQTLESAIDWSYESLPPAEAQFLRRLSVFAGGFGIAAAEAVGESEALGLDGLQSLIALVEKSLVIRTRGVRGEPRFTFLESIREYLLERLRANGEVDDARRRHAVYYLQLAERNFSEMEKGNQKAGFDLLEWEHDNLRAALQWSLDMAEYSLGKRIAVALWYFWGWRGHTQEALRWLESLLEKSAGPRDKTHMKILEAAGTLRGWQGDYERGKLLLMEALQIARERKDHRAIPMILAGLGWMFRMSGKTDQAAWLAEQLEVCHPDVDPWDLAYAYLSLGSLLYEAGRDDAAEEAFARSLEPFQFARENWTAIFAESKLALLKQNKGNFQGAKEGMVETLKLAAESDEATMIANCADDTVQLVMQEMGKQNTAQDLERVARVLGAVDHWREILSLRRAPRDQAAYREITETLRHHLGEERYLLAWKAGQSIPVKKVIREAAGLLELSGRPQPKHEAHSITLSEREHQVIGLVAEGLTDREIGRQLFITERTVRFHITSIFNKLGANNRAQAVAIAVERGML